MENKNLITFNPKMYNKLLSLSKYNQIQSQPAQNQNQYVQDQIFKEVRFNESQNLIFIIPKIEYDLDDQISTYEKYIDKYKNNNLRLNLQIRIPFDLIEKKNIDLLFFKISNQNNVFEYFEPNERYSLYVNYDYDSYELEDIPIFLDKKSKLEIKISYQKHKTIFDNTWKLKIDKNFSEDLDNYELQDNFQNNHFQKKRILTIIDLDYQEILENYEDGKKIVQFNDKTTNIQIKYNLLMAD